MAALAERLQVCTYSHCFPLPRSEVPAPNLIRLAYSQSLAETLVKADDRWRGRGDGMRQSKIIDDHVRVDTGMLS